MKQMMLIFKVLTLGLAFFLVLGLMKYLNSGALTEKANPVGQILGITPVDSAEQQIPRVQIKFGGAEANASTTQAPKNQTK